MSCVYGKPAYGAAQAPGGYKLKRFGHTWNIVPGKAHNDGSQETIEKANESARGRELAFIPQRKLAQDFTPLRCVQKLSIRLDATSEAS
jgi:hypothetical protein